ncbi:MAG: hypothetical protein QOE45_1301 [Frankiaceae bacterium]|jgi:hypothetical protein|nr:hypothetical protein [Frankiaceae bacterium]
MAESKSRLLPAVVTFVVVATVVIVVGKLTTWLLTTVILPIFAVVFAYGAARAVYRSGK